MQTREHRARVLAFFAGILSIAAFVIYNGKNLTGSTHPNISSWLVWAFITVLNFTSYKKMTGDWVKSILPTADSLMCILTSALAFYTGSFRNLDPTEWLCLFFGIVAGFVWWKWKSAAFAQVLLQIALMIGFIPTFAAVWSKPSVEPWLSWFMWTVTFITQFLVVKLTWQGKEKDPFRLDYLYPVGMTVFHGAVFILALR